MLTIICLTHNAPDYVCIFLNSFFAYPPQIEYELLVLDNASDAETVKLLQSFSDRITLIRSNTNLMFSRGNNTAFAFRSPQSTKTLLVNSDVEFISDQWLDPLFEAECSVAGYGCLSNPTRPDGWCYLIDTKLYETYGLDESLPFWGSSTKLTVDVIMGGGSACALENYGRFIRHFGHKSWPAGFYNQMKDKYASWVAGCPPANRIVLP